MRASVLPLLQVGHDAVDNVRLGREEVDGIDITVGGAAVSDLLNVWSKSEFRVCRPRRRVVVRRCVWEAYS